MPIDETRTPSSAARGRNPGDPAAPAWLVELADELAAELRALVLPHLGKAGARALAGRAAGGDRTFSIDALAEERIERFLRGCGRPVAVYSEDRGLQVFGQEAEYVLVIDPIDGTRPAAAGFEAACVSIAAARLPEPTMGDVVYAVIHEIKEGGVFRAARGAGVEAVDAGGRRRALELSRNVDLGRLFWTIGFRGRPAAELVAVLGALIDRSSVDGAVFDIGSATYSMTRILTGQLDAYIDIGPRMIAVAPWLEGRFREVGKGGVLNNAPYDVAASTLVLQEAGCPVTDAEGGSLDTRALLGADMRYQLAVIASCNEVLQAALVEEVSRGMESLRAARGATNRAEPRLAPGQEEGQ